MRPLVALLACLLSLPFAGCLGATSDAPVGDASGNQDSSTEPLTSTFTFGQSTGYDPRPLPVASDEPYHTSHAIVVPEGATRLVAQADWTCISLCSLETRLHDPTDAVLDRATGCCAATLEVAAPQAGTWSFRWLSGEHASVGVSGQVQVTILFT